MARPDGAKQGVERVPAAPPAPLISGLLLLGLMLLLVGTSQVVAAETPTPAPTLEVSLRDGTLTLISDGATLGSVLQEIGRQGRFQVQVTAAQALRPTTIVLRSVPLETGIRRLLAGTSHAVVYDPESGPGPPTLREVRVLATGGAGSTPFVPIQTASSLGGQVPPPVGGGPISAVDAARLLDAHATLREEMEAARRLAPSEAAHATAREAIENPRVQMLEELLEESRSASDTEARIAALGSLAELGRNVPRAQEVVLDALRDDDPRVRRQALSSLMGARRNLPHDVLFSMALDEEDSELRALAMHIAVNSLPPEEVAAVLERAAGDESLRIRITADELRNALP